MKNITLEALIEVFSEADNPTSAIRSIVPYYQTDKPDTETNAFILDKTIAHFRANKKPDGIYKLNFDLDLILAEKSETQIHIPFEFQTS